MKLEYEFEGVVEKFEGKGGWYYVKLPDDLLFEHKDSGSFGFSKIKVELGHQKWTSALMPMKGGCKFISIKASIRKLENINLGDNIKLKFTIEY